MGLRDTHPVLIAIFTALLLAACSDDEEKAAPLPDASIDVSLDAAPDAPPEADAGTDADAASDAEDAADIGIDADADAGDSIAFSALSAAVSARVDERGIPHLACQTDNDCFAAQGYLHAAHRFAQMDLRRRFGRGQLSSLVILDDDNLLDIDLSNRALLSAPDGTPLEEVFLSELDPDTLASLSAYTAGVNAWLADLRAGRNGAVLSEEYGFIAISPVPPRDWEMEDSAAVGLVFLLNLMDTSIGEIAATRRVADYAADPQLAIDLERGWHLDPDSPILTAAGVSYGGPSPNGLRAAPTLMPRPNPLLLRARRGLRRAERKLAALSKWRGAGPFGSNSWATRASKSATGVTTLGHDPHLTLSNPALWYLVHLDAKTSGSGDLHAAGVSFAGLPGVFLGHSETLAWGATVAYYDLSDVYIEQLAFEGIGANRRPVGVIFNGQTVPFVRRETVFERPSGPAVRELLFVPHHGPVLDIDPEAGTAISVRSVLPRASSDLAIFLNLARQPDVAAAEALLSTSTAAAFNFTVIDDKDTIAVFPFAGVPERRWDVVEHPAWLALDGSGAFEWRPGLLRGDDLPHVVNPPSDFVATANAAITDDMLDGIPGNDGYPPLQRITTSEGARQSRIVDVLEGAGALTLQDHFALQGDVLDWTAQRALPFALALADRATLSPGGQEVFDALSAWDYRCTTGLNGLSPSAEKGTGPDAASAIGCSAWGVFSRALTAAALDDEIAALGFPRRTAAHELRVTYWLLVDPTQLLGGARYWDDVSTFAFETPADIITRALNATSMLLRSDALFGAASTPDDWRWGRIHTLTLAADLISELTPNFNNGPWAMPGNGATVNVAPPRAPGRGAGNYEVAGGASMRMVVEATSDGMRGHFQLPGGQTHRRDSPNYDDLIEPWLRNEHFRMPFTRQEAMSAARTTITMSPAASE